MTTPAELSAALDVAQQAAARELHLAGIDPDLVLVHAVVLGEEEGRGTWRYCGAHHPRRALILELEDGEHVLATALEGLGATLRDLAGDGGILLKVGQG